MAAGPERLNDIPDENLIEDVAAGNRPAFEVLMRRHVKRSIAVADRILGDPGDAEDVVQEVFLQIWHHADRWRPGEGKFTTWLYRIVVNRSLDHRRRSRPLPLDDSALDRPSADPDAEAVLSERQLARQADAAVAALPERQRTALALCFYDELTCREAAKAMNVSVSAMESLLVRARRTVRERLWPLIRPSEGGGA